MIDGHITYETHVFSGDQIPFWMLYQYQHIRYRFISKTDWNVDLDHDNKIDVDEFDRRPETTHIVVTAFDKSTKTVKVVAGVRLIQTIYPYQLQNDSYQEMKAGIELPVDKEVVEGSRWVSKVNGTRAANIAVSLLMQKMFEHCHQYQMKTLIAAVPSRWEEWLNAYGVQTWGHRDTAVYQHHQEKYLIISFPVSDVFAQAGEVQRRNAEETTRVA